MRQISYHVVDVSVASNHPGLSLIVYFLSLRNNISMYCRGCQIATPCDLADQYYCNMAMIFVERRCIKLVTMLSMFLLIIFGYGSGGGKTEGASLKVIRRPALLPLSTASKWIIDQTGTRVKLACVNWAGHMEAGIPEGLSHNTADAIAKLVATNGFNCVRLTSSTWLWTNDTYGTTTVLQTFSSLNLSFAAVGIATFNPSFLFQTLRDVHKSVVETLGANGVMVILDNHVSKPGWCCADNDGNGFFGDEYFDPATWLAGLTIVAETFNNTAHVVAMSLRNELRGVISQNQNNIHEWFTHMQNAAQAVHAVNPDVLIVVGGLSYAHDLSFVSATRHLDASAFPNKLVYEFHWYKNWIGGSDSYDNISATDPCDVNRVEVENQVNFLRADGMVFTGPVLLSEFGIDQAATSFGDSRFLACVLGLLEQTDQDWALWALQGSYYLRNGVSDLDETYGLLTSTWNTIRNLNFLTLLRSTILNSSRVL